MIKKSCPECFSLKMYCPDCSKINAKNEDDAEEKVINKYIKNPTDRNYQIWKNLCNEFYPKKIRGLTK